MYDVPTPEALEQGQPWRVDPGSTWKSNLYTCASAATASVEQVTFAINGTSSLQDLQVLRVDKKNYTTGQEPLWGIEKLNSTKYQVWDAYKFWGLIDDQYADSSRVDAYRAAQIYLPAAVRGKVPTNMYDNFAAGGLFTATWQTVYENAASMDSTSTVGIPNYSGKLDYGLTLKWRQLSQKGPSGVERILNLIWTDIVAFAVAGTKTGFEDDDSFSSTKRKNASAIGTRQVQRYVRVIAYRDIRYAIPAFIAAALCLVPLILCFFLLVFQRHSWHALNHYMNQTNMGRTATQLRQLTGISVYAKTNEWSESAKNVMLEIPPISEPLDRPKPHSRGAISLRTQIPNRVERLEESRESQDTLISHDIEPVFGRHRARYHPVGSHDDQ